ncbi:hypothetical protein BZA70DRAFT_121811 [Myxozyma melibiosi]|uniref:Actin polymerization protein Bzz1 n=1 Tax=Myxozyma melibiosi TaxID=54550 RepID=A0ABR1F8B1_9ASCO
MDSVDENEIDDGLSFGTELKDGFKVTEAWIGNGIRWLEDLQMFYRERSTLEKEYSVKLLALTKKYFEKKAKKSISLSVGDTPQVTPGSLESASLVTWTDILTQTENMANEHDRLSSELSLQVADQLRGLQSRYEEFRRKHVTFNEKLDEERDLVYSELKKMKTQYDSSCQIVENSRTKAEKSFDNSKSKATRHFEQNQLDMNNSKNSYLIAINVANRVKDKYYFQDVPSLLDSMQDLNEARVRKLNSIWTEASNLELSCLERCRDHLQASVHAISLNDPFLDSAMFMRHNALADWAPPPDFVYEPSPIWHDDDEMIVDDPAQTFLRNKIAQSQRGILDLRSTVEQKRNEIETLYELREQAIKDPTKGNFDEVFTKLINAQRDAAVADTKRIALEVEVETVELVVGDIIKGTRPHDFKGVSFKIPTTCLFCNDTIWGLSRHGFKCRVCGYTCHAKCQMKVPADCAGAKVKKSKKKSKQTDNSSLNGNGNASDDDASSVMMPRSTNSITSHTSSMLGSVSRFGRRKAKSNASSTMPGGDPYELPGSSSAKTQTAHAKFAYTPNGDGEIPMSAGDEIEVLEPHDGTGWVLVRDGLAEGLVPFSYIELEPDMTRTSSISSSTASMMSGGLFKKKGPAVAPKRGAKKINYVVALYDYEGRTDAELTIHEGDKIVLTGGNTGEGWTEGELNGVIGSFPSNYVKPVD